MPDFLFTPSPNEAAIRFLKDKPVVSRTVFDGLLPELRARAFTIAGITNMGVLRKLRDRIAELPAGADWDAIKGDIAAELSPFMGTDRTAALRRAELVLRNTGFQAYSVAHYKTLSAQTDVFPYWEYDDADDGRVRPAHAALDGKIFPANADFWKTHFPPWEHGCRCNVIARTADDIAEIQAAEESAKTPLEARRVITGERLDRAEKDGVLWAEENGIPRQIDIRSPRQKHGGSGYSFDPSSLEVSLEDLRGRYDDETWATFEAWAKQTRIPEQERTVWQWLDKDGDGAPARPVRPAPRARRVRPALPAPIAPVQPVAPAPIAPIPAPVVPGVPAPAVTLEESLARINLPLDRPATPADMRALLDELREDSPVPLSDVVREIRGRSFGVASTANLTTWTREFMDLVPASVARQLPKLEIIAAPLSDRGQYFKGGTLKLSTTAIATEEQARRTLWHELAHWLHRERPGDDPWVKAIAAHFTARTAGEEMLHLEAYSRRTSGKRDKWYEAYAGRIYLYAEEQTHLGLEVPTRYAELLTMQPEELAKFWNDPTVRETLLITLRGFYTNA